MTSDPHACLIVGKHILNSILAIRHDEGTLTQTDWIYNHDNMNG